MAVSVRRENRYIDLTKAVKVMSRLVDKDSIVIKVSEPDNPVPRDELEYIARELREYIPEDIIPRTSLKRFLEEVATAVRTFVRRYCNRIKGETGTGRMYEEEYGIYSCYHPETGHFYMVLDDSRDWYYNVSDIRFYTTRNRREAEEEYKKLLEEMEGGEIWLETY